MPFSQYFHTSTSIDSVLQCDLKLSGNVSKRNKSRRDRQKAGADLSEFFEELITVDEDV